MFKPSDKIMRVGSYGGAGSAPHPQGHPRFKVVYSVAECWQSQAGTCLVLPVGFGRLYTPCGQLKGWRADAFRKLSEIQAENELARTISAANSAAVVK